MFILNAKDASNGYKIVYLIDFYDELVAGGTLVGVVGPAELIG